MDVRIEAPAPAHADDFLAAVARSRALHGTWVQPPADAEAFTRWLERRADGRHASWLVRTDPDADATPPSAPGGSLVGVVNVSEIVRGAFQSAYLGYYAFVPHAGRGLMRQGMALVLDACFGELALHRVEANVQPSNLTSIALVRGLGFRREGFSPRYLAIDGEWRDHERWALLTDEWPGAAALREPRSH